MKKIIFTFFVLINSLLAQVEIEELGRFGGTGTEPGLFEKCGKYRNSIANAAACIAAVISV